MAHEHQTMAGSIARRRFLHLLWNSAAGFAAPATDAPPFFEEIPPAASGIQWKHVAGLSSKMYVPETIGPGCALDRKSTRLNSSHLGISYAVFCLKKQSLLQRVFQ